MISDEYAPAHAVSLVQSLGYASGYAEELRAMLAEGNPHPERAARLVQALRNMLCDAEDHLDALDDTQAAIDAATAMQRLSDADLFRALAEPPTPENS
ncbi:hypothetical protein ACFWR9_31750 [Streptomyces sp. NPDC058534]|uniref:hypothetical protein n=1 Tax=Streptomyces sp. NPDC058534 TaxID=3346541 RepID=UPI003666E79F